MRFWFGFGENSLIGITRPAVGLAEFAVLRFELAVALSIRAGLSIRAAFARGEATGRLLGVTCDTGDDAVKSRCEKSRTRRWP